MDLAGIDDLDRTMDRILGTVLSLPGIDAGGIFLRDRATGGMNLIVHRGLSTAFLSRIATLSAGSWAVEFAHSRTPEYSGEAEIATEERLAACRSEGLRAIALSPVLFADETQALIFIASRSLTALPAETRDLIEGITRAVGGVIGRVRNEAVIRSRQDNLASLLDALDDMVYAIDHKGEVLYGNRTLADRLGYDVRSLRGMSIFELHPAGRREEARAALAEILTGQRETCYIPLLARDGTEVPVETHFSAGEWEFRQVLIGVSRDSGSRDEADRLLNLQRDLAFEMGEQRDLDAALALLLSYLMRIEGLDCGGIYLIDGGSGDLDLIAHRGLTPEFAAGVKHYPRNSMQGRLARTGENVYVRFDELARTVTDMPEEPTLRAVALLPIWHREEVIGLVNLGSRSHDHIAETSRSAIEAIVLQIGGILAHFRHEGESRERLENLRSLFEGVQDMILVLAPDGTILDLNPMVEKRLGYDRADLLGRNAADLHAPADGERVRRTVAAALGGVADVGDIALRTRTGEAVPVDARLTRGIWNGQEAVFCVPRDMTQFVEQQHLLSLQHNVALKLNRTADRTETLTAALDEILGIPGLDHGGVYLRDGASDDFRLIVHRGVDPAFAESVGILRSGSPEYRFAEGGTSFFGRYDELVERIGVRNGNPGLEHVGFVPVRTHGVSTALLIVGSLSVAFNETRRAAIESIAAFLGERLECLAGQEALRRQSEELERRVAARTEELTEANRRLEREVEERRRAETKRLLEERYHHTLIENITDIVLVLDDEGRMIDPSPSMVTALGYERGEITGRRFFDFLHQEDISGALVHFLQCLQKPGRSLTHEVRFRNKAGDWRLLEIIGKSLLNDPVVAGVIINARDITDRRRTEEALAANRRDASIGRMASTVAHEINNPLTAIKTRVELLREIHADSADVMENAAAILQQVDRIARTTRLLLGFARHRAQSFTRVALGDVVRGVAGLLEPALRLKGVKLAIEIPEGLPTLHGDVEKLQEVLVNLIENARDVLDKDRTLWVRGLAGEGIVELRVEDDGPGLGDDPEKLFEPFYTTKFQGTGLGLPIARKICESHGGRLEAFNREGGGAVFRVVLPCERTAPTITEIDRATASGTIAT